jgi:hypothetical protein
MWNELSAIKKQWQIRNLTSGEIAWLISQTEKTEKLERAAKKASVMCAVLEPQIAGDILKEALANMDEKH